jgi:hypothetical protein
MKIIALISCLIFSLLTPAFAQRAMVIVLEAPLLNAPNMEAKVVQRVRKGDIIPLEQSQFKRDRDQLEGFFETWDRNANTVYIPKLYVKLITHDDREFETSVTRWGHDPTDYRLEEPLAEFYPLYLGERRRIFANFSMGSHTKANYLYRRDFQSEEFISRKGVQLGYLHNIPFDTTDRLYFGPMLQGASEQALFAFSDDARARESRGLIGIGPYISYDSYRSEDYLLTIGGGFFLNWNRHLITYATRAGDEENRIFNGLSLASKAQTVFHFRNVFPNMNFIIGAEAELALPHTLSPQNAPQLNRVWNSSFDQIRVPLQSHYSFFIGLVSTY